MSFGKLIDKVLGETIHDLRDRQIFFMKWFVCLFIINLIVSAIELFLPAEVLVSLEIIGKGADPSGPFALVRFILAICAIFISLNFTKLSNMHVVGRTTLAVIAFFNLGFIINLVYMIVRILNTSPSKPREVE